MSFRPTTNTVRNGPKATQQKKGLKNEANDVNGAERDGERKNVCD